MVPSAATIIGAAVPVSTAMGGASGAPMGMRSNEGSLHNAGPVGSSTEMAYDAFTNAVSGLDMPQSNNSFDPMGDLANLTNAGAGPDNAGGGEILLQTAPGMDVGGQPLRPPVFMTPLQIQMHQQLKAKHAELFKKIVEQQEELRKVSEQLLMTQYGLVPVSVAPLPFPTQVPSHMVVAPQTTLGGGVTNPSPVGHSSSSRGGGPSGGGGANNRRGGPNVNDSQNNSLFGPLEMQMGYANVMPQVTSNQKNSQRNHCAPQRR